MSDVLAVAVHVRPRAHRTHVGGTHDGALVVAVTAPADRGRATDAARRAVADALGVPAGAVTLLSGATSRRKRLGVTVGGADRPAIEQRLAALRGDRSS